MKKIFYIIISFSVLTVVWQLVVMASGVNRALFPGPVDTLRAFGELFTSGLKGSQSSLNLWQHIGFSMYRFGIGYAIAVVCGVAGGIALGIFSKAFAFINPVIPVSYTHLYCVMDTCGASMKNGSNIWLWFYAKDNGAQQWKIYK